MLKNEGDRLIRVVVCTPNREYFRVNNLQAQNINQIADRDQTIVQHDNLKSILKKFGCDVIDAPELNDHPNSVFTRDVALSTHEGFIQLRMGLEARRGEETWMAHILENLDEPCIGKIEPPGTVEGGDTVLAGEVVFAGLSGRTNDEGLTQLSKLLGKMNIKLRIVNLKRNYLHIGGAMSMIGPERLVCCEQVFPGNFFTGFDTIEVPNQNFKPSVGNVICLRENEVIANSAENMETIIILQQNGVKVHQLDLSEFRKGAGGPTCLILPVS